MANFLGNIGLLPGYRTVNGGLIREFTQLRVKITRKFHVKACNGVGKSGGNPCYLALRSGWRCIWTESLPPCQHLGRLAAKRLLDENLADNTVRIDHTYRRTLGRDATSREREILLKFLEGEKDKTKAWTQILLGLYASLDFRYLN